MKDISGNFNLRDRYARVLRNRVYMVSRDLSDAWNRRSMLLVISMWWIVE